MDKRRRNYVLRIEVDSESGSGTQFLEIKPPFTIEFDIIRNRFSNMNTASVRIYNLSEKNRKKIVKNLNDPGNFKQLILRAGYEENLPVVLNVLIKQAWSVRRGVDFITEIQTFDGGNAAVSSQVNRSYPAGTDQREVIKDLAGTLTQHGVSVGAIGDYPGKISRGASYSGNAVDIVNDLTSQGFFIDNGVCNALNQNECIQGAILVVNSKSGLLGTPVREFNNYNFEMIFEPRFYIGQKIKIESSTFPESTGFYKVNQLSHKVLISGSVCGNAITSVGCAKGELLSVAADGLFHG